MAKKHGADTVVLWVTTDRELAQKRATEESENQETRIWGNMRLQDFHRMSDNLQPPDDDEHVVKIDGSQADEASIKAALNL